MYRDDETTKHPRGQDHHAATLTNTDAQAIYHAWQRRRREWGIQTRLAHEYQVSPGTVHRIVRRHSWRRATQADAQGDGHDARG